MNKMDEEPHPEGSMNFLKSAKLNESDYSSGEDNMIALIRNDISKLESLNMPIRIGNISITLLVDSGVRAVFSIGLSRRK